VSGGEENDWAELQEKEGGKGEGKWASRSAGPHRGKEEGVERRVRSHAVHVMWREGRPLG